MTLTAKATLIGVAPLSFSRSHKTEKLNKESADDYEKRTWREKLHTNEKGEVVFNPMAFKNNIKEAAKFISIKIPGKGQATYSKHFESGILVRNQPLILVRKPDGSYAPILKTEVVGEVISVPSNGVAGYGKRVDKTFPIIPMGWKATVDYLILDDVITPDVFTEHLVQAGQSIGVGTFRVRNGGVCGSFRVESIDFARYQSEAKKVKITIDGVAA